MASKSWRASTVQLHQIFRDSSDSRARLAGICVCTESMGVVVFTQSPCKVDMKAARRRSRVERSGVTCLMPRVPLIGECHGGIPFAKHFRNSVHQFRELLSFLGGKILTKARVESPASFNFVAGHVRHDADEFDFVSCLCSRPLYFRGIGPIREWRSRKAGI